MKLIVIGASAGGLDPITDVVGGLPADLDAAIIVIRHLAKDSPDRLTPIVEKRAELSVQAATDGALLERGRVFVAQPDTQVRFRTESRDGVWRVVLRVVDDSEGESVSPTVDVTLQAAAALFGRDLIAVILSGRLDDGTEGAIELAKYGGKTIVQAPLDADYSSMPMNVIDRDSPRHVVDSKTIPKILRTLCGPDKD